MSTDNISENKKATKDFYVKLYFDYVTGDETVVLISRTLGINGVSFWVWLNAVMSKYDGLFTPRDIDLLLYSDEDKNIALNYIQKFKEMNILWETNERKFTTVFLRDTYLTRLQESKRKSLVSGRFKGKGNLSESDRAAISKDIEAEVAAFFEKEKVRYDRRYPINIQSCFMDRMYDEALPEPSSYQPIEFVNHEEVYPEEDIPEEIFQSDPYFTIEDSDYSLLDDTCPDEVTFEEEPVQPNMWQAPTVPVDVQAKIDEQAKPEATTEGTDSEAVKKLMSWGLYQSQIKSVLDATTPEILDAYIQMTEANAREPGKYIMALLKKGAKISKPVETPVVTPVEPKQEAPTVTQVQDSTSEFKPILAEDDYRRMFDDAVQTIYLMFGMNSSLSYLKDTGWKSRRANNEPIKVVHTIQTYAHILEKVKPQLLKKFESNPHDLDQHLFQVIANDRLSDNIINEWSQLSSNPEVVENIEKMAQNGNPIAQMGLKLNNIQ